MRAITTSVILIVLWAASMLMAGDIDVVTNNDPAGTYKIAGEASLSQNDVENCCIRRGNANRDPDNIVNISDVTYLAEYLFGVPLGPEPLCLEEGNANGDISGDINISDITFLVNFLFGIPLGPPPPACPGGSSGTGELESYGTCKDFGISKTSSETPPSQDCIQYEYDGTGTLLLKHVNAGFNCCPTELLADITIENGVITIDEREDLTGGGCYCLCLFDLDYRISDLPPALYRIVVKGMYLNEGDEPLDFMVDLVNSPSGSYCVERDHYPWTF